MKIYCAHSSSFDFIKEFYSPLSTSERLKGHDLVLPHFSKEAMANSRELIGRCDLMFAEVSYPSTGLGIELGWANVVHLPIFAIHRINVHPTGAIHCVTQKIVGYERLQEIPDRLFESISEMKDSLIQN